MKAETIINQVQALLLADATLSTYVTKVYQGVRSDIPDKNFPCIILEPVMNTERNELDSNVLQRLYLKLSINAYIRAHKMDLQISGDATHVGILDIENDIKKALSAYYPSLNGECIHFKFLQSQYDIERWPIRGVSMEVDFYYQQNILTRA